METYERLQQVADLLATIIIDNMEIEQERSAKSVDVDDDLDNAA